MAKRKISELPVCGALSGAEILELVQGGVNKQASAALFASLATLLPEADDPFRGYWDASVNQYPTTGGRGPGGAVAAGDYWAIDTAGTLPGPEPVIADDVILAGVDVPGQLGANWVVLDQNASNAPLRRKFNLSDLKNKATAWANLLGNTRVAEYLATVVGFADGIAPLGSDSKVPAPYLPSYVDDVLEYADLASFPVTGETSKIYVALDTGKAYRWSGSAYVEISASPGSTDAVPEGVTNLYFTNARAIAALAAITDALQAAIDAKIGGTLGATANAVPVASGAGGKTAQATPVLIDPSTGQMSGHGSRIVDYADSADLALADAGSVIRSTKATAMTITIRLQSAIAYRDGTQYGLIQRGAGQLTIAAEGGVTLNSKGGNKKLPAQFAGATLVRDGLNEWTLIGDLTA